jgi:hypothetical protein
MWQKAFILLIGVAILMLSLMAMIEYACDYAALIAPTVLALTESIHTRKEIFHSGHPTNIQHH